MPSAATMRARVESSRASAICDATVRFQIRSYSFASSPERPISARVRMPVPAGRIASCASWALRTLPENWRGDGERYSLP